MHKPPDRFTHASSVSVEKVDASQCRRPPPRHKQSFIVDLSTSARQVHQDNHFSKLKQVIEARNRTRGIEFDAIFLTIGVPNCIIFVLGNLWVEEFGY